MPFVKRNDEGEIVAVSKERTEEIAEECRLTTEQLDTFLNDHPVSGYIGDTDQAFVRVLEDVVELLIEKGVFMFTELPESAQKRVLERQRLRSELGDRLSLIEDE